MARQITGEACRPEAIQFVAQQFHAYLEMINSPLVALIGKDPPDEDEILGQMTDQGITFAEITLGVGIAVGVQLKRREAAQAEAHREQIRLAEAS